MKTTTYTIPSIHCMHCAHTIKMELNEIKGVNNVEVDVQNKKVSITHEDSVMEDQIINTLRDINYAPEL